MPASGLSKIFGDRVPSSVHHSLSTSHHFYLLNPYVAGNQFDNVILLQVRSSAWSHKTRSGCGPTSSTLCPGSTTQLPATSTSLPPILCPPISQKLSFSTPSSCSWTTDQCSTSLSTPSLAAWIWVPTISTLFLPWMYVNFQKIKPCWDTEYLDQLPTLLYPLSILPTYLHHLNLQVSTSIMNIWGWLK